MQYVVALSSKKEQTIWYCQENNRKLLTVYNEANHKKLSLNDNVK